MELVLPHVHTYSKAFGSDLPGASCANRSHGGIAIVIECILLILFVLALSEVENEICPLMVPEVWTPELGKFCFLEPGLVRLKIFCSGRWIG